MNTSHSVYLTQHVLQTFSLGEKKYNTESKFFDSLDYSRDGEFLASGCEDNVVRIYNCVNSAKIHEIPSEKYGVDLVRFSHSNDYIFYASRNKNFDHALRYLGVKKKQFVRYFKGHTDLVLSLDLSPVSDHFCSSSVDNTVRFWDLRTSQCQGKMSTKGKPLCAYGPKGLVIAVASMINTIKLFSVRSYESGPFKTIIIDDSPLDIKFIKFSPDGTYLLVLCSTGIFLLDSFSGKKVWRVQAKLHNVTEADFSPNSKFVVCSADNGSIFCWETKPFWGKSAPNIVKVIEKTGHSSFIKLTKFNPKYTLFTTAGKELNLWIPKQIKK